MVARGLRGKGERRWEGKKRVKGKWGMGNGGERGRGRGKGERGRGFVRKGWETRE